VFDEIPPRPAPQSQRFYVFYFAVIFAFFPVFFKNHVCGLAGRIRCARRQDYFGEFCSRFIAFGRVSIDSKVRYPER